jgi:hypothetical protein
MDFIETHKSKEFGNFTIVLQEYLEYDTHNPQTIYNVSMEHSSFGGTLTSTLDLFETYDYRKAEQFFIGLVENIMKTNGVK